MGLSLRTVSVFLTGVVIGIIVSLLSFLTIIDTAAYSRDYSIGYDELTNWEILRNINESRSSENNTAVRVTCWVQTTAERHAKYGVAVKSTWGRRCDNLVFSFSDDPELGGVGVKGRVWGKTKAGLRHLYEHHFNDSDWFLKTNDDTYVIMDNLRHLLSKRNSSDLVYLGHRSKHGYISGGSGYVLSSASLQLIVEKGLTNGSLCSSSHRGLEEVVLARCLHNLGILAGDTRDELGRDRFFPLPLEGMMAPTRRLWSQFYHRVECCSDTALAFQYIQHGSMFELDYLLYRVLVHGDRGDAVGHKPGSDMAGDKPQSSGDKTQSSTSHSHLQATVF